MRLPALALYPGLPSQLFFVAVGKRAHGCEKSCEGRPGYEAIPAPHECCAQTSTLQEMSVYLTADRVHFFLGIAIV